MNKDRVTRWVQAHPLSPIHVDCAITVMLKILDGKCKMRETEKLVMERLYDEIKNQPGQVLEPELRPLIATARKHLDDAMKNSIYEKRLLAETTLSRPVMKKFKAMIRQEGLLDDMLDEEEET